MRKHFCRVIRARWLLTLLDRSIALSPSVAQEGQDRMVFESLVTEWVSRKQKKAQDKVPMAPSEVKAKDVVDDEASQSSSSSSDDGKSEGPVRCRSKEEERRTFR